MDLIIFTKGGCPSCIKAKALLDRKGINYTVVDCDVDIDYYRQLIREEYSWSTFPLAISDDPLNKIIGGYESLKEFLK